MFLNKILKDVIWLFEGKIGRLKFISYELLIGFAGFLVWIAIQYLQPSAASSLLVIYWVVGFIVSLALCVRRMRDIGHSLYWLLLLFVPVAGLLMSVYLLIARPVVTSPKPASESSSNPIVIGKLIQGEKQVILKTTIAVVVSTALSAVLLWLVYPFMVFLTFLIIINVSHLVSTFAEDHLNVTGWVSYIFCGLAVLLAGAMLNFNFTKKLPLPYKIISLIIYILLTAGIAFLLSGNIQYQLNHAFI